MNGVIYARYSSDNQREESIEGQIRECNAYAQRKGIEVVGQYIDRALSARTDNRPEFQRMIKESYSKGFQNVIVWKRDRFGRNRYDMMKYNAILDKNGCKLLSATENISEGSDGIILASVLDGVNEAYSVDLAQKVRRGEKENVINGKGNGGRTPYGYDLKDSHYFINEKEAEIVRYIYKEYAESKITINGLAVLLKQKGFVTRTGEPFSHGSLSCMLGNKKYIGEYSWGETTNEDFMPHIIDDDLFNRVQKKKEKNKRIPQVYKTDVEYILTTKLICGTCGSFMVGDSTLKKKTGKIYRYYTCSKVKHGRKCTKKSVEKEAIEKLVVIATLKFISEKENKATMVQELYDYLQQECPFIQQMESTIAETQKKMNNIMKAIEDGFASDELKERYNKLKADKTEIERNLEVERIKNPSLSKDQIEYVINEYSQFDPDDIEERKVLINTFVNSVYLYDNQPYIDIFFNFKNGQRRIKLEDIGSTTHVPCSTKWSPDAHPSDTSIKRAICVKVCYH
jgi:site-specific DNA recombinase